jgi:CRP-like cAMP-binding protein
MPHRPQTENDFLSKMSAAEFELVRPHLTRVRLKPGAQLYGIGERVRDVFFPESGLVVMRTPSGGGEGVALALAGRDGMIGGLFAAASVPASCSADVLIDGDALRISADTFIAVLEAEPPIRRLAGFFHAAIMAQSQRTGSCGINHSLESRLSRWLLEISDRTGAVDIPLQQACLAQMLGVQRTTVNLVVGQLAAAGAVACGRGHIRIIDRAALERRSCDCYRWLKAYLGAVFSAPVAADTTDRVQLPACS